MYTVLWPGGTHIGTFINVYKTWVVYMEYFVVVVWNRISQVWYLLYILYISLPLIALSFILYCWWPPNFLTLIDQTMYVDIIHHCGLLYICIYWNPYRPADQPLQIISNSDFLLNIVMTKKFRRRKRFDPSDSLPVVVVEMVRCEPARFKFCYLPVGVNKNSWSPLCSRMWTRPSIPVYITSIWYKKLLLWPSL